MNCFRQCLLNENDIDDMEEKLNDILIKPVHIEV